TRLMLRSLTHGLVERARCAKHNLLDDVTFSVSYSRGLYVVRTADEGTLRFSSNPYLSFFQIEGYLRKGGWTIEPGQTVVDAGACLGEFAAYAATRVGPAGRVIVFEPDPANCRAMREHFALNDGAENVTILHE